APPVPATRSAKGSPRDAGRLQCPIALRAIASDQEFADFPWSRARSTRRAESSAIRGGHLVDRARDGESPTHRRTQSPMVLPLLEKHIDNIEVEPERLWQLDAIRRWSSSGRFANAQRHALTHRDNLRDGRLPVQHGNRFAIPDRPKVLAEARLQLRYPNG